MTHSLYRGLDIAVDRRCKELTTGNVKQLLTDSALVIDTFDNSTSRQAVKDYCIHCQIPCLHLGLADSYAEIIPNQIYRLLSPANDDVCDYPASCNDGNLLQLQLKHEVTITAYLFFVRYIRTGRDAPQSLMGETPKTALLSIPQEF